MLPTIPLPTLPFPALPSIQFIGLPSGVDLQTPGLVPNQPNIPSPLQALSQSLNSLNAFAAQALSNPLALIASPITFPALMSQQYGDKVKAGTLQGHFTNVSTPMSGAWVQLQPSPTNVVEAQLVNTSSVQISVTSAKLGTNEPDAGSATPVAAGKTFNFGAIDLSLMFIGNTTDNTIVNVKLYLEQ